MLIKGINAIYDSPVCDKSFLAQALGNSTITDSNVMQYLGGVEQRTNELLQLQALLDQKEKDAWEAKEMELREQMEDDLEFDATKTLGPKPRPGGLLGSGPAQAIPPTAIIPENVALDLEQLPEEEEDVARPLSHAEMKMKIMSTMSRKQKI